MVERTITLYPYLLSCYRQSEADIYTSRDEGCGNRILEVCRQLKDKTGQWPTAALVCDYAKSRIYNREQISKTLKILEDLGLVEKMSYVNAKGGRPSTRYCVA